MVDVGEETMIVQVVGDEGKMDALERMLRPFGIVETVSTGRIAMVRGATTSKPAPIITLGFEGFVQLVMAAITTSPCVSSNTSSSSVTVATSP